MNRWQRAVQFQSSAQLFKGHVRFPGQKLFHLAPVRGEDLRLAAAMVMTRPDLSGVPALLNQFLHKAQRHAEAHRHLLASSLSAIVSSQNSFTQIQRDGSHLEL